MEVIRTFHPIGQGAFYSEQFISDNKVVKTIVYDCGSINRKVLEKAIPSCFCGHPDIDILFVSHFDADHINGISTLKKHYNIKRVVLPLLKDEDKSYSRYIIMSSIVLLIINWSENS